MLRHHTRYNDLDDLDHYTAAEIEDVESRYNTTIEWSNSDLEGSVAELKAYLRKLNQYTQGGDDNEWKVRFESQTALNKQLQERKEWLETELKETRRKCNTGTYPEALNFNLDALSEPELLRLVKHLEKMRNTLYSTLRDTEWKLDKETKEFHNLDEMRRIYRADLKQAANYTRLALDPIEASGLVSPIYPADGYFGWLDTYSGGVGGGSLPRLPPPNKKRTGVGVSQVHEKNKSQSLPRSKSRNEKKNAIKKEAYNGNITDDLSIGDQDVSSSDAAAAAALM